MNIHARYLRLQEIDDLVTPLLKRDFGPFGYRDRQISEEEDFDGMPIIRLRAEVEQAVPAKELVQTLGKIHDLLRSKDEERFVFLSAPGPNPVLPDGDEDFDEGFD
ncbi:hypothetical protein [Rhizobium sp.]